MREIAAECGVPTQNLNPKAPHYTVTQIKAGSPTVWKTVLIVQGDLSVEIGIQRWVYFGVNIL